jgi:hypothetical protein
MKNAIFLDVAPSESCYTNVSEERVAYMFREDRISQLGTTLALSNSTTLRRTKEIKLVFLFSVVQFASYC